jgi:hypothetical protein
MRFLKYLQEKYTGIYKYAGHHTEVYENPSPNEIRMMPKIYKSSDTYPDCSIRFIAYAPKKQIFIWASDGGIHMGVFKYLKQKGELGGARHIADTGVFSGYASQGGNKMQFERGYGLGAGEIDIRTSDWAYLNNYFGNMARVADYIGRPDD